MTTEHRCDVCGEEITKGYTVEWKEDIDNRDLRLGMVTVAERNTAHVCGSCWPGDDRWYEVLRGLF